MHQRPDRPLVDPAARGRRGTAPRPRPGTSSCGRPRSRATGRARGRPGTPYGTVRSLRPLPKHPHHPTRAVDVVDVEPAQLADPDAGGVEQLEDRDVAQPDRAAVVGARRRRPRAGRAPRRRRAPAAACWCALGEPSEAPGSVSARPVRSAQAVKTRTAVARRAIVERALPSVCCLASQLRSVRRSSVRTSVCPSAAACSSSPRTSPR